MPRPRKPRWPPLPKRPYGAGSLSRDAATGEIRARLPARVSPTRRSRLFPPDAAAEASSWLDSHLTPAAAAASPADTLADWAGYWHSTFVAPVRPHTTTRLYLYALRRLEPIYSTLLAELRPSQLQAVVGALSGHLSAATLRGVVMVWRRCLDAAVQDGLLTRNPARGLTLPPMERGQRERRHITAQELAVLWPAIRGHRFEAAYALLLGCGLRIGEILGLSWAHVDLDAATAWIERQYTDGQWRPMPKGRNPHRIPLPPAVVAALRRHRARQPEGAVLVMQSEMTRGRRARRTPLAGPLPWSAPVVRADFARLLADLKIAPAVPHAGRHGLASFWLDNGVPAAVVAQRLGHAHAGTTLTFYARTGDEGQARADELAAQRLPEGVSEAETA